MRKLVVSLLALCWLAAGCGGTDTLREVDGLALAGPSALDFGRVGLGATVARTVTVRNGGHAPLTILEHTIEGEGEDFEVENIGREHLREGQSTRIEVRFTPDKEAVLERVLELRTDDPRQEVIQVPVTGIGVRPRLMTSPAALDFGKVELGITVTLPLTLNNGFDIPVQVELFRTGDPQFSIEPDGTASVGPNRLTEIEVSYRPNRLGPADGLISIRPCPICDSVLVPITGFGIDEALEIVPPEIDFGWVPIERIVHREFTITNVSSQPVEIFSMELVPGRPAFGLEPFVGVLQPDQAIVMEVSFLPTEVSYDEDWVEIASTSQRSPLRRVHLFGHGGGPQIQVAPPGLAFGSVPIGARAQLPLIIVNAGADVAAPPLEILEIRVENPAGAPFGVDRDLVAHPVTLVAGTQDRVTIGYEPLFVAADDHAELVVVSNDLLVPEVRIPMIGSAFAAKPCSDLIVTPSDLDFGSFPEGWGGTLSFKIENPGRETCIMRNLQIAPGSDPAFSTEPVASFLIRGQSWFGWMVRFDPRAAGAGSGAHVGELELFAVNAGLQRYTVGLRAYSEDGCLQADPNFVDFGTDANGCGTHERTVRFTNTCQGPVDIRAIDIGAQASDADFTVAGRPRTPFALGSLRSFDVHVRWNTGVQGITSAPLQVYEGSRTHPLTVPLVGELLREGWIVDNFVQRSRGAADVLLVVDNSSSLVEEQSRLRAAAPVLVDEARRRGVDAHFAVTSTGITVAPAPKFVCPGGAQGAEAGRFFPVDGSRPRIVTGATPNAAAVLGDNTQVGYCHELEQGLEAMRLALSEPLLSADNAGFLREDSSLAVIFVSDDEDKSGYPSETYADFLLALKGRGGAVAHAIVYTGAEECREGVAVGLRYLEVVRATGGFALSECARDWAPLLRQMADRIFAPPAPFLLSGRPDASGLRVNVDGRPADPATWRYDAPTNTVSFARGAEPPAGTRIEVGYTEQCN